MFDKVISTNNVDGGTATVCFLSMDYAGAENLIYDHTNSLIEAPWRNI